MNGKRLLIAAGILLALMLIRYFLPENGPKLCEVLADCIRTDGFTPLPW